MSLVKIAPILETISKSYCSFVKVAFLFWNFFGKFNFFEVAKFKFEKKVHVNSLQVITLVKIALIETKLEFYSPFLRV